MVYWTTKNINYGKVKEKEYKGKSNESSIYSGVAINIADDCKPSKKNGQRLD